MTHRNTVQKQRVFQALCATRSHPTAEMLYHQLRQQYPEIGIATVYRNLNRLEQEGLIRRLALKNQVDRFDGDLTPHFHLVCTRCGAVEDVFDLTCQLAGLLEQIGRNRPDYHIEGQELVLYGVCAQCSEHDGRPAVAISPTNQHDNKERRL